MYRLMGTTWEPFCSTFDPWGILDEVPFGQYLVVEQNLDTELKVRRYERSYLAQFSGPFKDPVPLEVVDWLTATALSPKLLPDTLHP